MKKITVYILLAIMLLSLLASCAGGTPAETSEEITSAAPATGVTVTSDKQTEYVIVRPDGEKTPDTTKAVMDLSKAFSAVGVTTKIVTDWEGAGKYLIPAIDTEICVGNVARNGKYYDFDVASLEDSSFVVKIIDSRLIICGNDDLGTAKAVDWFISEFGGRLDNLSFPADYEYRGSFDAPSGIRIMTQNLLATDEEYQNNMNDANYASRSTVKLEDHTLAKRHPRVLELIDKYKPDSMGVQECSSPWRTYFDANLSKINYGIVYADKNKKIAVIYNKATVKPIKNGSFWLTEKPESLSISKEWGTSSDGLTERLGMYVVFQVLATGDRYVHMNTHVDTEKNSTVQTKQTEVLLSYAEKLSKDYAYPFFMTGDFNYTMDSSAYTTLTSGIFCDTKKNARSSSGNGSFNKFIGPEYNSKPIDQVLASKEGVTILTYKVVYDKIDGCFISDHYAVYSDVRFE